MNLVNCLDPERLQDWWRTQIWKQAVTAGRGSSKVLDMGLWGHRGGNTCFCLVSRVVESITEGFPEDGVLQPYQGG